MSATIHALPTADLTTRTEVEAARDLAAEQAAENRHLRMVLAARRFAEPRPCAVCGERHPIPKLVNTGTGHAPRWVCGLCRMVEVGR